MMFRIVLTIFILVYCSVAKAGADDFSDFLQKDNVEVVIVGDRHGTIEAPQYFYSLVTSLLPEYEHIHVLLELTPKALEIDYKPEFLESIDLEYFKNTRFWNRDFQDGRSSIAMAELIYKLKKLNADKVSIGALMEPYSTGKKKQEGRRFEKAANKTLSKLKNNELVMIFVGNLHASREPTNQIDLTLPSNLSFTTYLELSHKILTFEMLHNGGLAWQCFKGKVKAVECGERSLEPVLNKSNLLGFHLYKEHENGYDGYYYVGKLHSSPPLKYLLKEK